MYLSIKLLGARVGKSTDVDDIFGQLICNGLMYRWQGGAGYTRGRFQYWTRAEPEAGM